MITDKTDIGGNSAMASPTGSEGKETDGRREGSSAPFRSTWQAPLPEDEIGRQESVRARLTPGMEVTLRGIGDFCYSGIWDTMHTFHPLPSNPWPSMPGGWVSPLPPRYFRRDMHGRPFIQLPYTLLADFVEPTRLQEK